MRSTLHAQRFLRATGFAEYCKTCASEQLGLLQLVKQTRAQLENSLGIADKNDSLALHHELGKVRAIVDSDGRLISTDLPLWLSTVLQLDEKQLKPLRQGRPLSARPTTSRYHSSCSACPSRPPVVGSPTSCRLRVQPRREHDHRAPDTRGAEARPGAAQVKLTDSEKITFLMHGMLPPVAPRPPTTPRQAAAERADGSTARKAKSRVERLIRKREGVLAKLRLVLPTPLSPQARHKATQQLLDESVLLDCRRRLASLLLLVQRLGGQIYRALGEWRRALRADFAYFSAAPGDESDGEQHKGFYYKGTNYVRKMAVDLGFLPLPIEREPLLLRWFSEQLPWCLSQEHERVFPTSPAPCSNSSNSSNSSAVARSTRARLQDKGRGPPLAEDAVQTVLSAADHFNALTPPKPKFKSDIQRRGAVATRRSQVQTGVALAGKASYERAQLAARQPTETPTQQPDVTFSSWNAASSSYDIYSLDGLPKNMRDGATETEAGSPKSVDHLRPDELAAAAEKRAREDERACQALLEHQVARIAHEASEAGRAHCVHEALDESHPTAPEELWRWNAFQKLLYGAEVFPLLLLRLPFWVRLQELDSAAAAVQQQYRHRVVRKIARLNRLALEAKREEERQVKAFQELRVIVA